MQVRKFVSGGQTGADRAALDFAITNGYAHGGWCPRGRRAEDGVLDMRYQLTETQSKAYRQRTKRNVLESDATLIFNLGRLAGGSLRTMEIAKRNGKPVLVVSLDDGLGSGQINTVTSWLRHHSVCILNVAGPRERKRPGIYRGVLVALASLHRAFAETDDAR